MKIIINGLKYTLRFIFAAWPLILIAALIIYDGSYEYSYIGD